MLLSELANALSARLEGDGNYDITGVNTIQDAEAGQLCFVLSDKYIEGIQRTKASAVLVQKPLVNTQIAQLVVEDVQRALIKALGLFAPKVSGFKGVNATAVIDPSAQIDPTAAIGPGVCISAGVRIGALSVIGSGCFIGENSSIGDRTRLDANVAVYHNCQIGKDCIIQANSTIGSTGFGYYCINGRHQLIPHNGGVIIEDNVEIGANSCVDRAKFGNTVIGAGTKIDNLVQVAHNVQIGKHCLLAGQAALAGSARLGNYVVLAGRVGVIDNVTIGDFAIAGVNALVTSDIENNKKILGFHAQELQNELKCVAVYHNLPELVKEVRQLKKKVEKLESAKNNKE